MLLPYPEIYGVLALAGRLRDTQLPHHGHRVVSFPALYELAVRDTHDLHPGQRHPVAGGGDARKLPFVGASVRSTRSYLIPLGYLVLNLDVEIREG